MVHCMSAQADLSAGAQQEDTEDILQKIDLSGIDEWDLRIQEAWDWICMFAFSSKMT